MEPHSTAMCSSRCKSLVATELYLRRAAISQWPYEQMEAFGHGEPTLAVNLVSAALATTTCQSQSPALLSYLAQSPRLAQATM